MSKLVKFEIARYKIPDIEYASVQLVTLFAKHSGIAGTNYWMGSLLKLHDNFRQEKYDSWMLPARGLELTFSGFKNPVPTIEDDMVVFKSRDPRFTLETVHQKLRPRERTEVEKVTEEIAMEMNEVYKLQVDNYPTTLIFPRDLYAEVERVNAVML